MAHENLPQVNHAFTASHNGCRVLTKIFDDGTVLIKQGDNIVSMTRTVALMLYRHLSALEG